MMLSIGVLGDVMLGRGVAQRLNQSPGHAVWGEALLALAASLDLVIANLECCLAIGGRPTRRIARKPFFFRGPRSATTQLQRLGVRVVGLANNHALDYEEWALGETLAVLKQAGIAVSGAGRGGAARRPAIVAAGGARVGLLAIADHPAEYAARDGHLGIAHADLRRELPVWICETLERLQASCDAVIAFPHWGPTAGSTLVCINRYIRMEALALDVRDGMNRVVVTVGPGHTLREAARRMTRADVGAAVVIDPDAGGPGIITERDLLHASGADEDLDSELVRDHLRQRLIYASADWSLERAADEMVRGRFRHVVVLDGSEVVGILSMRDIVRCWTATGATSTMSRRSM